MISRRGLVGGVLSAASVASFAGVTRADASVHPEPVFGVQLWSVRNLLAKDFDGALA